MENGTTQNPAAETNQNNSQAPTPEPVTFTPQQQEVIDRIIQERLARNENKFKKELESVRQEKATLESKLQTTNPNIGENSTNGESTNNTQNPSIEEQLAEFKRISENSKKEVEAARKAAEQKEKEAKQARERLLDQQKRWAIANEAAKANFFDNDLVVELVSKNVKVDEDGNITVVGDNGEQRYNAAYQPMTLGEFLNEFGQKRQYLVRSDVKTGTGSTQSQGMPNGSKYNLEDLFGPKANAKLANELALKDKRQYMSLREQAKERGLVR